MAVSAFLDDILIAQGTRETVTRRIEERYPASDFGSIRVFDDATGRVTDLDYWDASRKAGPEAEPVPAAPPAPPARGRGRPKLGVVAREVTLLPRHWDWLAAQKGGASAALRRLVDGARKRHSESLTAAEAREGVHRFLTEMAGDRPGYEEALRALYRSDIAAVRSIAADWPEDIRRYLNRLLDRDVA